jgi:hypothetical protein
MAIDILEGIDVADPDVHQRPRHDLESVLYLFLNMLHGSMSTELRAAAPEFNRQQESIYGASNRLAAGDLWITRSEQNLRRLGDDLVRRHADFRPLQSLLHALRGIQYDGVRKRIYTYTSSGSDTTLADAQDSEECFWILSSAMYDEFIAFADS